MMSLFLYRLPFTLLFLFRCRFRFRFPFPFLFRIPVSGFSRRPKYIISLNISAHSTKPTVILRKSKGNSYSQTCIILRTG